MTVETAPLKSYLHSCKSRLSDPDSIFVIGNEAADCDSIVSAICWAYLGGKKEYIPVVNNKKDVVSLRAEVAVALASAGVGFDDLIYLEEVLSAGRHYKFFLVDHNEPSAQWERLGLEYSVVGLIDHHEDGGLFKDAEKREISVCASTVSLIVKGLDSPLPPFMYQMLLTALTFDTTNWTWRVTDVDVQSASSLTGIQSVDGLHEHCAPIIQTIEQNLIPEGSVPPTILLRKDYKLYMKNGLFYGISVIKIDLKSLDVIDAMKCVMREDALSLMIVLAAIRLPGEYTFYQQFAAAHESADDFSRIMAELREPLQLVTISEGASEGVYDMLNLSLARKAVQPMVQKLF